MTLVERIFEYRIRQQVEIDDMQFGFMKGKGTTRRYASTAYAMTMCQSVCVCPSQVGVLLKQLNIGTRKQRHTIAQGL